MIKDLASSNRGFLKAEVAFAHRYFLLVIRALVCFFSFGWCSCSLDNIEFFDCVIFKGFSQEACCDNIQLDGLVGDTWNQIIGLIACKGMGLIISLLSIIILIHFTFLGDYVKRIKPAEDRLSVTELLNYRFSSCKTEDSSG
jgi:hypothetical protein